MLDTRYGVKYSMPHSIVHIVDNSMYTGELPTVVVDDPSLYTTIVVSGAPMGTDNEIITINRSDVLNVAFGMHNVGKSDIEKYGQSITYPTALIAQNVPVKFMRVTPADSTYAFSCLLIQWRWDGRKMHVRFKTTSGNSNNGLPLGLIHSSFKNPSRLNAALVRGFTENNKTDDDGNVWKQRVFMTQIAAGRGKAYNFYNYAINPTTQSRRPANVRYLFSTIDTRTDLQVEKFFASLINTNSAETVDAIETVNTQVGKRVKGSSILIPTINEAVVRELYNDYRAHMKDMIDADLAPSENVDGDNTMKFVKDVYATLTINTFDPIYGRYIYNGDSNVLLPYFQVEMFNLDIPKLETANRISVILDKKEDVLKYSENPEALKALLNSKTVGITNETEDVGCHIGDVYLSNTNTMMLSLITSINQYTGSVTSIPISQIKLSDGTKDMLRGYVTVKQITDTASVTKEIKNLIDQKRLIPRVNTDKSTASKIIYRPDCILVGYNQTAGNSPDRFTFATVVYNDNNGSPVVSRVDIVSPDNAGDIYSMFVYPTSAVTMFATTATSVGGFWNTPGATIINLDETNASTALTKGAVYVNDFDGEKVPVVSDHPFNIGTCPTSVKVSQNIVNTSYDVIMYSNKDDSNFNWSIIAGTPVTDTNVKDYKVGDIVTLTTGATTEGTDFRITEVDSTGKPTAVIVETSSSPTKLEPKTYDVSATTTYEYILIDTAPDDWSTNYTNYYVQNINVGYDKVTGDSAPTFEIGKYYSRTEKKTSGTGLKIKVDTDDITVTIPSIVTPDYIQRYTVSGTQGSIYRYGTSTTDIPANYYSMSYGINPNSQLGGIAVENGYAGFFDDDISDIEFKWKYSELLVKAYRGDASLDPRIMSPTRCPAKFMFDGGTNTIVGTTILPYMQYKPIDIINASTIYTADEKEAILLDNSLIDGIKEFADIDVKQAMYDLMVYRCYQGIPEDKRPIGPGSGLSLHLDSGVTDASTAVAVNNSFTKRFNNPNASWDIGGYVSSVDGISYTYIQRIVENMFKHIKQYNINKPYVGTYTNIHPDEYVSFFPDIDTTDWDMRELYYNSGGNAWIMDCNGNLQRRSQRTLYREGDTSDIIQESNMRTLSQLTYRLQNKIDTYILEYNDDGVLKTLKDEVDNMFSNWAGNLVQDLDITFQRDINPIDGGDILVCYCNVTFRGLILRVPIIVNIQRRNDAG